MFYIMVKYDYNSIYLSIIIHPALQNPFISNCHDCFGEGIHIKLIMLSAVPATDYLANIKIPSMRINCDVITFVVQSLPR